MSEESKALGIVERTALEAEIVQALNGVYDPEIPASIYEVGLIYGIDIATNGDVLIRMTLTSPACPVAEILPAQVEAAVAKLEGTGEVKVAVVWDPPWNPSMMSEAAQLQLGFY